MERRQGGRRGQLEHRTWRVFAVGAAALLLVSGLVLLVVARGPSAQQHLAARDVPPKSAPPDESTTSIASSASTTSTTAAPATTTTSPPPIQLRSAAGGLTLDATIEPGSASRAALVRFTVQATDEQGGLVAAGVDYGDGTPVGIPGPPHADCRTSPAGTAKASEPTHEQVVFEHAYRQSGSYRVHVVVTAGGCNRPDARTDASTDYLVLSVGPLLSNGPRLPTVATTQPPADSTHNDPSTAYIDIDATDLDGYISSVVVDWGDGTSPTVKTTSLAECIEEATHFPVSSRVVEATHRYLTGGTHSISVIASSVGCDGASRQDAKVSGSVTTQST